MSIKERIIENSRGYRVHFRVDDISGSDADYIADDLEKDIEVALDCILREDLNFVDTRKELYESQQTILERDAQLREANAWQDSYRSQLNINEELQQRNDNQRKNIVSLSEITEEQSVEIEALRKYARSLRDNVLQNEASAIQMSSEVLPIFAPEQVDEFIDHLQGDEVHAEEN